MNALQYSACGWVVHSHRALTAVSIHATSLNCYEMLSLLLSFD
jgi:hypothetical protein